MAEVGCAGAGVVVSSPHSVSSADGVGVGVTGADVVTAGVDAGETAVGVCGGMVEGNVTVVVFEALPPAVTEKYIASSEAPR